MCPGGALWSRRFGGEDFDFAYNVFLDGAGSILVTGPLFAPLDFGGGQLESAGGQDIFVAKLDASGGPLWARRFGDGDFQSVESVAMDASGQVIFTGSFDGTIDLGGGAITSAGGGDAFLAKFPGSTR